MAISINEVLTKVLDNANVGKAVTDVGPGFALSISLLMAIGLYTDISVLPADRLRTLNQEIVTAKQDLVQKKKKLCDLLDAQGAQCTEQQDEKRAEEGVVLGRRRIAELDADVDQHREAMKAALKAGKVDEAKKLVDQTALRQLEVLAAQKELVEEQTAKLEKLNNQQTDASSLEFNLVSFTSNISVVIAFSVVLGIIVSQVSHFLFVDLLYSRFKRIRDLDKQISVEQTLSKQDDELVKNYYRYVEGSINMVVPVMLFGIVFPYYAHRKLGVDLSVGSCVTSSFVVAALLIGAGFQTYASFLEKRKALADSETLALTPKIT